MNIGILRKISNYSNNNQDPAPDLLVFGYQCKLFRDDEKALSIERQLIGHSSDEDLKIDRYDVRGALHDLSSYESQPGGYGNRLDYLSPNERKAEELCEEERYYSLFKNEVEEELFKEEESKRNATSYSEIGFNYEEIGPKGPTTEETLDEEGSNQGDEPLFVPPATLNIPTEMEIPKTQKHHAIIEKTAKFIASQGLQMEILLKTKQANNIQFDFLNHNGKYNHYYKFILDLIKNNNYHVHVEEVKSEENSQASEDSFNFSKRYMEPESVVKVPQISYKPSADCAYTQLISKITGASISAIEQKQSAAASSSPVNGTAEVKKISSGLLGLVQHYNSSSESEDDEDTAEAKSELTPSTSLSVYNGAFPPENLQLIIDKTAAYVAKNGQDFEESLRAKQDPRFTFLNDSNEFHSYYVFKVNQIKFPYGVKPSVAKPQVLVKILTPPPPIITKKQPPVLIPANPNPEKPKITPVSFSIKTKEENSVPLKAVKLVQEPSSDEEGVEQGTSGSGHVTEMYNDSVDELERQIDSINESNEKREARKAEDKLKDKLAIAAREKLSLLTKEKQLQIERKKRAMIFLDQIKNSTPANGANGDELANKDTSENDKEIVTLDSDNDSVYSIPSPPKDIVMKKFKSRSRSRTRSFSRSESSSRSSRSRKRKHSRSRSSSRHKRKKSKKSHSKKKKSRRYSHSRSYSRSPSHSKYKKNSRKRSRSRDRRHRSDRSRSRR